MGLVAKVRRRLRPPRPAFVAWDACLPAVGRGRLQQPVLPPAPFAEPAPGTLVSFPDRGVSVAPPAADQRRAG